MGNAVKILLGLVFKLVYKCIFFTKNVPTLRKHLKLCDMTISI